MIGQHPDLYGFPELRLFTTDTVEECLNYQARLADRFPFETRLGPPGLLRTLAQLVRGCQTSDAILEASAWLNERRNWGTKRVVDYLLELIHPRSGVEKSPETSLSSDNFQRVLTMYPAARFLHLTRHPISTQQSLQKHWRQWNPEIAAALLPVHCAQLWYQTHRRIMAFTSSLPPEQRMRVRSEDLLAEPEVVLKRIVAWLGVRSDHEAIVAMKHPEHSVYACRGPANAVDGNDPLFLRCPVLRPTTVPPSLVPPAEWGLDSWLQLRILSLAAQMGYG